MKTFSLCFIVTVVVGFGASAQSNDASSLAFARDVAIRALTFAQGDRQAIPRLQSSFTDEGWKQFRATLDTFVDSSGTPRFGSTFVPSGAGRVVDERDGVRHVRVPGADADAKPIQDDLPGLRGGRVDRRRPAAGFALD